MSHAEFIRASLAAAQEAVDAGAPIIPEVAASQAALESCYGTSRLAREANNLFGVKAGKSWTGQVLELPTKEWRDGAEVTERGRWRAYTSWEECFADYGAIIASRPWYADAASAARACLETPDYEAPSDRYYHEAARAFLRGLLPDPHGPGRADDEPGWATDPKYFDKVWALVEAWSPHLR